MKKFVSAIVYAVFAIVLLYPLTAEEVHAAFTPRTSMPSYTSEAGKAYYYTNNNVFYKHNLGPNRKYLKNYKGYCTGNCTWYAYGRASEILGEPLNTNFRWSASVWWETNKEGNYYPYGSKPKVGAIACYSTHVAIVEKVVDGKPYVSESGWRISSAKPTSASKLRFHYGTPWEGTPKGYIYITDAVSPSGEEVNYSIKISKSDLNMRTGPGTGYSRIGYVKKGTYQVNRESGNWARLADSGYWVCLDYVTKVATTTPTVSTAGSAADYQVKVSATNLNMRTGPSTKYKRMGYIKPGTYTINKTKNGWGMVEETGYWIYLKYASKVNTTSSEKPETTAVTGKTSNSSTAAVTLYKVKINASELRMRTGPGTSYSSKGTVKKGSKYAIKDTKNGWGQLKKNGYWIKLSYTIPVNGEYNVKVTIKDLNMRKGPGTSYARKGYIKKGVHTITKTKGSWGKLKSNGYWIKLSYVKKI